jgi:hypothetical protein
MPSLRELQQHFAADLLSGGDTVPTFAGAAGARGSERLAIYRRSIASNYRNAMSATYPVVRRIVGTSFFVAAVDAYVEAHPSRSGDLNEYGDAFGDFVERYPQAATLPYLCDVARLEWAIDEASRAADSPFEPDAVLGALSQVAAEALPGLRLRTEPSCRLLSSAFPLLQIWQVNQPDYSGDMRVDFTAGPDHLRLRRERDNERQGVGIERLDAGNFGWLSALDKGATLAEAIERALDADAAFDLQAALQRFIGDGTVAGIGARAT